MMMKNILLTCNLAWVDGLRGMNSAFEPREGERQVEGLFESLLAEAFEA